MRLVTSQSSESMEIAMQVAMQMATQAVMHRVIEAEAEVDTPQQVKLIAGRVTGIEAKVHAL